MINTELKEYLDTQILPQYTSYDRGHNTDHIEAVAEASLELSRGRAVSLDMVYTAAIFHDLGLIEGRETHHLVSAKMLKKDNFIRDYFSALELEVIAEAIEDHRASAKEAPRTIYGEILSSADRIIDADTIIRRSYFHSLKHYPEYTLTQHIERILSHINDKYAEGGYLKIPILTEKNAEGLRKLRELASSQENFITRCKAIIEEL